MWIQEELREGCLRNWRLTQAKIQDLHPCLPSHYFEMHHWSGFLPSQYSSLASGFHGVDSPEFRLIFSHFFLWQQQIALPLTESWVPTSHRNTRQCCLMQDRPCFEEKLSILEKEKNAESEGIWHKWIYNLEQKRTSQILFQFLIEPMRILKSREVICQVSPTQGVQNWNDQISSQMGYVFKLWSTEHLDYFNVLWRLPREKGVERI